ncbi:hypothetical protein CISIN_1g040964mg, partial [Citrus sinensis]
MKTHTYWLYAFTKAIMRNLAQFYSLFLITENLVENLLGDFEYEIQVPYLLYRNASQEVNGIWFYNPRESPQAPSLTLSSSSTPIAIHDTPDPISSSNRVTNLVKPSFFSPPSASSTLMMPPISSSVPTAPALNPPLSLQRPYGAPMLQPFPPPTPPPSLTPSSAPPIDRPLITREKVRDALLMLVQ